MLEEQFLEWVVLQVGIFIFICIEFVEYLKINLSHFLDYKQSMAPEKNWMIPIVFTNQLQKTIYCEYAAE